ncbi:TlpA family protein disulfide reductase [Candidatus Thiosymbion oneisti]|uniref:TlpA family protein disulfide reductase n=1 Tax=Candidatus Thiosymbion oneisti TaxID=589554 RepID=UPI000B7DD3BA|nr:TlpA disulfide reductase family protein [Candidatus Thiosymbion oneisti]
MSTRPRYKIILTVVVAAALGVLFARFLFDWKWLGEGPGFGPPFLHSRNSETDLLDQLPQFRLPDLDGQEVASSRWAGKILVLNFWATWCPPCLRELPLFDELQRTHAEAGLQVVGIAIDNHEDVERFLAEHPASFPILLGDTDAIELSRRLGNHVQGLPFTAIFDSHGRRVYAQSGEVTRAALTEQLGPLLN